MDNNQAQPATLEDYIVEHQQKWSALVTELNSKMKNFAEEAGSS